MSPPEPVLICGLSGRALARSARAAGYAPIVLDAFGDLDTRAVAEAWARIPIDRRWRFSRPALLAGATRLAPPPIPLVWGSGFERRTDLLRELQAGRPGWGMPAAAVRALKEPWRFARLAQALGIAHPDIRPTPPADPAGWLVKRHGAAGGGHVRRATARPPAGRGWYWQRLTRGRPVSALVQGNGGDARVLAFSEQWTTPRGTAAWSDARYRFAGAVAPATLTPAAAARLDGWAAALGRQGGLVGLASVDALVAGDTVSVLEINPRPGASLDAYELALGINLFRLHREGCAGRLAPALVPEQAGGSAIVYATRALRAPAGFAWPDSTADRTPDGTVLAVGAPVCTVLAAAGSAMAVRRLLAERTRLVLQALCMTERRGPASGRRPGAGSAGSPDARHGIASPGAAP